MREHYLLAGRTALVTGAARRIGRAVALGLARQGADIIVHYHTSSSQAELLAAEISESGRKSFTVQADLRNHSETTGLIKQALGKAGRLDILINNASIFPGDTFHELSLEQLTENMAVNAWAPFVLAREFAALGNNGDIVNFLDARITDYDKNHVAYHLSKRTFFSLTSQMAVEFAPAIKVNNIAPGLILPPPGKNEQYLEKLAKSNPLQRWGNLEDITSAVLFMLTNSFITGQTIFIDGGRHLKGHFYGI